MAINWDDPTSVDQARQKAISAGYKPAEVDAFMTGKRKEQSTIRLAQSGALPEETYKSIVKDNPLLAEKIASAGAVPKPAETEKAKQAAKAKNDIVEVAKQMQAVIKSKDQYDPKTYKDTINSLASSIVLKKKEAENLGAALSGSELGILSGQVPTVQTIGPSFPQKVGAFFTGKQPVQHGEVADNETTINNKLALLIAGMQGQKITPEMMAAQSGGQPQGAGIATKLGGLVGNIIKPGVDFGKMALGAGYEGVRGAASALGDKNAYNPAVHQNPFLNEGELKKYANPVNGLKTTAGAMTYAVPFGKGAGIAAKALIPGAAVGGLQAASQENATPESVAGNAVLGAGGAGLLHGILNLPKLASQGANGGSELGKKLSQSVRKIDVGADVNGAAKEAGVNKALDSLGIRGSAQKQYAQLGPKMSELSDKIEKTLSKNPIEVPLDAIKKDFQGNLTDQLRTGNLSSKGAQKEISGYLQDLYGNKLGDTISTNDLFSLKKKINQDYQGVAKKIMTGSPLNDREKVISAARQTIDDVISQAHPNVKAFTVLQSKLYDAAESLHKSRNASGPGLKLGGLKIGIPGGAAQAGKDALASMLMGNGGSKPKELNPAILQALQQVVTRTAASQK